MNTNNRLSEFSPSFVPNSSVFNVVLTSVESNL